MEKSHFRYHLKILIFSVVVIALSVVLSPDPGTLELFGLQLPPLCAYRIFLGLECLGCGMTRSFAYMGHLDWGMAWEMNRGGPFLWFIVAIQLPYRAVQLWRKRAPA